MISVPKLHALFGHTSDLLNPAADPCSASYGGVQDSCSGTDDEEARRGTWRAMEQLVLSGRASAIGVSNYREEHLLSLLSDPRASLRPAVNQVLQKGYTDGGMTMAV